MEMGIILAAGKGTRLGDLVTHTPKPLLPLAGKPFISYSIEQMIQVGIKKIIVNTHYLAEEIHTYLATCLYREQVEFIISHEEEELGVGGGVLNAMQQYGKQPLLLINSDVLFIDSAPILSPLIEKWQNDMHALLLLKDKVEIDYEDKGNYDLLENGKLKVGTKYIYTGAAILSPALFGKHKVEFFSYIDSINADSQCYGMLTTAKWFDLGTVTRLNKAEAFLLSNLDVF